MLIEKIYIKKKRNERESYQVGQSTAIVSTDGSRNAEDREFDCLGATRSSATGKMISTCNEMPSGHNFNVNKGLIDYRDLNR